MIRKKIQKLYETPNFGFTLAEVLITLGIIGVVAAMTIPTLISNYQDKVQETRYKKAKNILINGYKLMMSKEQVFDVSNLDIMRQFEDMPSLASAHREVFKILQDSESGLDKDNLPVDYIITDSTDPSPFSWTDVPFVFQVADGSLYGIESGEDLKNFYIYADINSSTGPNTVKKDLYKFIVAGNGNVADVSNELEENNICSADNLSACQTEEACRAIGESYSNGSAGGCWCIYSSQGFGNNPGCGIKWSETDGCFQTSLFNKYCS